MMFQQLPIGPGGISIGHNQISLDQLTTAELHAASIAIARDDLLNACIIADAAAKLGDEARQPFHKRAHATHGVVNTMQALEMGDETIISCRGEGIAADQERVEAERDAQLLMRKVIADLAIDRAETTELDQIRSSRDQRTESVERLVCQFLEGDFVDRSAILQEAFKGWQIFPADALNFAAHPFQRCGTAQHIAIIEADAIEGIHRPQINLVFKTLTCQRP